MLALPCLPAQDIDATLGDLEKRATTAVQQSLPVCAIDMG